MSTLAFELLFRFLWGGLLVLTLVSRRETSERFPRIATYIALGTSVPAAYLLYYSAELQREKLLALAALLIGSSLYSFTQARLWRSLGFLLLLGGPVAWLAHLSPWTIFNFLSGSLLVGSVFASQYLGHWFLTVPNLPIREFQKVVKLIFVALLLKGVDVSVTLIQATPKASASAWDEMGRPQGIDLTQTHAVEMVSDVSSTLGVRGDSYFGLGFFGLLILAARLLWGLLAPVLLVFMIKKTVDMRSTQSATGILYALSVMLIIGEGAALYLNQILGWHL